MINYKQILYGLKRQYGRRVDLYKIDSTIVVETGEQTRAQTVTTVQRAVVLDAREFSTFFNSPIASNANQSLSMGGFFELGERVAIVDKRDVVDIQYTYFVYGNKKYEIVSTELMEHDYMLFVGKETKGDTFSQKFVYSLHQEIKLEQANE